MNEFYEILEKCFEEQLSSKTNWGRNEVKVAFDKAFIKAVSILADRKGFNIT